MLTKKNSSPSKNDARTNSEQAKPPGRDRKRQNSLFDESLESLANETSRQKTGTKSRIIVKYDVGFENTIFIRGSGGSLSWHHGIPMKNIGADEWIWEIDEHFVILEFKVLINDEIYEIGENQLLREGETKTYNPIF